MFGRITLARYGLAAYGFSALWVGYGYATFLNEQHQYVAGFCWCGYNVLPYYQ